MKCPLCGLHGAGRIGRERYYCRQCFHEWSGKQSNLKIFAILKDGTLLPIKRESYLLEYTRL